VTIGRSITDVSTSLETPEAGRGRVDARLVRAFSDPDPAKGLRAARALASELDRQHLGAAASLREGLEEMFTVRRLGPGGRLCRTLSSTNPVESMISTAGRPPATSSAGGTGRWSAAGSRPGC
jgi:putative transposase